jgi:hypothetical protein
MVGLWEGSRMFVCILQAISISDAISSDIRARTGICNLNSSSARSMLRRQHVFEVRFPLTCATLPLFKGINGDRARSRR